LSIAKHLKNIMPADEIYFEQNVCMTYLSIS